MGPLSWPGGVGAVQPLPLVTAQWAGRVHKTVLPSGCQGNILTHRSPHGLKVLPEVAPRTNSRHRAWGATHHFFPPVLWSPFSSSFWGQGASSPNSSSLQDGRGGPDGNGQEEDDKNPPQWSAPCRGYPLTLPRRINSSVMMEASVSSSSHKFA